MTQIEKKSCLFWLHVKRIPQLTEQFQKDRSILDQIREKDKLLSYPYESIKPFLKSIMYCFCHLFTGVISTTGTVNASRGRRSLAHDSCFRRAAGESFLD
ncbi:MAG: hypothetical protein MR304_12250 [Eubacterium sp.]|nr:hypothetical protein [Eubacterium sp.]